MKARFVPLALIATLLLTFGALAAACGGDGGGPLTLDEYFERLESLSASYDADGNALDEALQEDFASASAEDEQIAAFRDFLDEAVSLVNDFVNSIDDLDPPAEVADAHDAGVSAGRDLVEMFDSAVVIAEISDSIAELAGIFDAPGFVEASDAFTDACLALESSAEENGITVDLLCG